MITWQIWLVVGIACLVIEMLNAGFGIICLAFGAFLSAIASAVGLNLVWQLIALALGTFLSYLFVLPVMKRWLDNKRSHQINLDSLIGRQATVVEDIDSGKGRVTIDGIDWRAVSELDAPISKGSIVTITERQGNTLTVQQ